MIKDPLDVARHKALALCRSAMDMMLSASVPCSMGSGTSYSVMPERDRKAVNAIAFAVGYLDKEKVLTDQEYLTPKSVEGYISEATMKKRRTQDLRIAKANRRNNKKLRRGGGVPH